MPRVNLYSDTQTRPTAGMRAAIAAAEVGDEQRKEDPTTLALEERVAELFGHEAAVFLPSGTMCNEIAIRLHIRPGGDEMFIGRATHPLIAEAGGPAAAVRRGLRSSTARPAFQPATLEDAMRRVRRPLRAAPAAGLRRADHEHGRWSACGRSTSARRARRRARAAG